MRTMSEIMNETTNEPTNGTHKTAYEAAIAYEAAMSASAPADDVATSEAPPADDVPPTPAAPDVTAAPAASVDDNVTSAAVREYEAATREVEPAVNGASVASLPEGLRLRMKVWTDRATAKRYLMPSAFMRDVVNGQPVTDVMYAYAMRDDDTKLVTLTATEWNALPFFYFKEDGAAPRATTRPIDVVMR